MQWPYQRTQSPYSSDVQTNSNFSEKKKLGEIIIKKTVPVVIPILIEYKIPTFYVSSFYNTSYSKYKTLIS